MMRHDEMKRMPRSSAKYVCQECHKTISVEEHKDFDGLCKHCYETEGVGGTSK